MSFLDLILTILYYLIKSSPIFIDLLVKLSLKYKTIPLHVTINSHLA